jgi:hypothetical protein
MNIPFEAIKEKFAVFGKVMDVEENLNAGLSRSVFITYFTREAVLSALNYPEPIFLNRESLKVSVWGPFGDPDADGGGPGPSGGADNSRH